MEEREAIIMKLKYRIWLCNLIFTREQKAYLFELIAREILRTEKRDPLAISVCEILDTAPVRLGTMYALHQFDLKELWGRGCND